MVLSNKEWLDKMDEIITAIQNGGDSQVIEDMLSNMWVSSVTYNVGDYVLYNNNIWKCLVQNSNIAPTEGSTWTSVKITNEISTLNSNLDAFKNKTSIESYKFNTSSDVEQDSYTVQHTGWAMLYYMFNQSEYSQFSLFINGANVFGNNITNGNSKFDGTGAIPLYLQKGDVVIIAYYSTFRMYSIELRVRY